MWAKKFIAVNLSAIFKNVISSSDFRRGRFNSSCEFLKTLLMQKVLLGFPDVMIVIICMATKLRVFM